MNQPRRVVRAELGAATALLLALGARWSWQRIAQLRKSARQLENVNVQLRAANGRLMKHDELRVHFLAMASHELRTPLTSISGFASTLRDRWEQIDDDRRMAFITIVCAQSERLAGLVNDILTLSRLEGGEFPVHPAPVEVFEPINRAVETIGDDAVNVSCPREIAAYADPQCIQQIVVNLVRNARKYGAEPIEVVAEKYEDWVQLVVEDHGPGVEDEFVPLLFTKFAQAPGLRGPDPTGTGLGLAIVRALAEAQGGEVWYESVEPHGARFNVRIPAAERYRALRAGRV